MNNVINTTVNTSTYIATDVVRDNYVPHRSLEFKSHVVKIYAPIEDGMANVDFTTVEKGTYDLLPNQSAGKTFSAVEVFNIIRESIDFSVSQGATKISWTPSDAKRDSVYKNFAKRNGYTVQYTNDGYPFIDLNTTNTQETIMNTTVIANSVANTQEIINTQKEGTMKTIDYTAGVNRFTKDTIKNLVESETYKFSFSKYIKAKDKPAFEEAVKARYEQLIEQGVLTPGFFNVEPIEGSTIEVRVVPVEVEEETSTTVVLTLESNQSAQEESNMKDNTISLENVDVSPVTTFVDEEFYPDYEDIISEGYSSEEYASLIEDTTFHYDVAIHKPEMISGLIKKVVSKEEMKNQSLISFASKTISYGRILVLLMKYSQHEQYPQGNSPWTPVLNTLKKFIENELKTAKDTQHQQVVYGTYDVPAVSKAKEVYDYLKVASPILADKFKAAGQFLKGGGMKWLTSFKMSFNKNLNIFLSGKTGYLTNGIAFNANDTSEISIKWGIKGNVPMSITSDNFDSKSLKALSRLLIIKNGLVHKYMHKDAESTLDSKAVYMPLYEALFLANALRVDMKTLTQNSLNYLLVAPNKHGVLKVSQDPIDIVKSMGLQNHFGISNPDTLDKGILRANHSYNGFANHFVVGGQSFYSSFESDNKTVARAIKLDKQDIVHYMNLSKVYVVTDTMDNEYAIRALSTGTIHVPTEVLERHGQVRAVSAADRGGFKCTLGPVSAINPDWDAEGISLASFGSLKAKLFGLTQLLGLEYTKEVVDELSKYTKTINFWGKPIEVVEVKNVILGITSHYVLNQFEFANRDAIVQSLAEADANVLKRAEERASTIKEDAVFVDYVLAQRDTLFNGSLMDTISGLLKLGEIRVKNKKVSVTPSEFDILATTHSPEKSREWLDSLLAENINNAKKREQIYRAVRIGSGTAASEKKYTRTVDVVSFFKELVIIYKENNVDIYNRLPSFASRNFLVDVATRLFSDVDTEGNKVLWLNITDGKNTVTVPTGDYMYGKFYEDSSIFEHKTQITGMLSGFFKASQYMVSYVAQHGMKDLYSDYNFTKAFNQFIFNMDMEMQAYSLGKKIGKLKATGISAVLSVAWWSRNISTVYFLGMHRFKTKGKQAVLVKHPELFMESITGVDVKGMFPKHITKRMDKKTLRVLSFAFQNTVFVSEEIALSLQNDADGDLVRLTWHKDFTLENFENKVADANWFASKFHNEYTQGERDFTGGCKKFREYNTYSNDVILSAVQKAAKSKAGVAKYTSLAQRFARYADAVGMDKTSNEYRYTHLLLNVAVQVFSMNEIKQTNNNKGNQNLMDYFLLKDFDVTNRNEYYPLFVQFLDKIGATGESLASTGFRTAEEWLQYIEFCLMGMKDYYITNKLEDAAYSLIASDFVLAQETSVRQVSIADIKSSNTFYAYIIKAFLEDFNKCAKEGRDYFSPSSTVVDTTEEVTVELENTDVKEVEVVESTVEPEVILENQGVEVEEVVEDFEEEGLDLINQESEEDAPMDSLTLSTITLENKGVTTGNSVTVGTLAGSTTLGGDSLATVSGFTLS